MSKKQSDNYNGGSSGKYWHEQLDHYEQKFRGWQDRGDKVVARYRDDREANDLGNKKFNILWSNVQVLSPSLYGRPAKPQVSRRFRDQDVVGRLASTILERTLMYEVEQFPAFQETMAGSVEDRLLPGRGTSWVRADTADVADGGIDKEYSPAEYVYWKDFRHSPARTWEEVWWVARAVYLTEAKGIDRFGPVFKNVPLVDFKEEDPKQKDKARDSSAKEAKVWEIWNKRTRKVCWVAENYPAALDEKDDPLQLEGFFPCPKPLYATTTRGTLIPIPDYTEYQDQAEELDVITGRISKIVRAIKAVGVYNKEFKEVGRMLVEGVDNQMFGVDNWMALAEKNGLKGNIELLDLTTQIQALAALYTARDQAKHTIYEICGISDLLRGDTKAEETLGAQQLKANFGNLRLRDSQVDVARYATDIFKLKAQIICRFYPPDVLLQMSGVLGTSDGQDPQLVQAALALLRESTARDFQISVESDSLAQIDEIEEKTAANEAIQAIGGFLREAVPMVQQAPETLPMAQEMLLFLVRRHKAGRELEAAIEQAMKLLQQKAMAAAQNPPPSEAEIEAMATAEAEKLRAQISMQTEQMKAQLDKEVQQGKLQQEMQLEQLKSQLEEKLARLDGQIKLAEASMKDETERYKAELQAQTQLAVAQISAESKLKTTEKQVESTTKGKSVSIAEKTMPVLAEKLELLTQDFQTLKKPRKKRVLRDAENRITGIEEIESSEVN